MEGASNRTKLQQCGVEVFTLFNTVSKGLSTIMRGNISMKKLNGHQD